MPREGGASGTPRLFDGITAASGILNPRLRGDDECMWLCDLAACSARVLHFVSPLKSEGAGKTGCALHPRSRVQLRTEKRAHEHTGSAGASRPSLRSGFTAYNVISPENGSFASVIGGTPPANLTPAPRRQDHTTSPYASCAFVFCAIRVHRIPPRVRDDREPPLVTGETGGIIAMICPTGRAEYFFAKGWTARRCPMWK